MATAASMIVNLGADRLPMAWFTFGPPCQSIYFPVLLVGELPRAFAQGGPTLNRQSLWWRLQQLAARAASSREARAHVRSSRDELQAHLDREAEEFAAEGWVLRQKGELAELHRQAGFFMQHALEQFEKVLGPLEMTPARAVVRAGERTLSV
jgi:dipeptidase